MAFVEAGKEKQPYLSFTNTVNKVHLCTHNGES